MILSKTLDTAMSMADGKGETSNKLEILIGGKNIEPGQYVPKAGEITHYILFVSVLVAI